MDIFIFLSISTFPKPSHFSQRSFFLNQQIKSNLINLTGFADGSQRFQSLRKKFVLGQVIIENPGEGYENKRRLIPSAGINTYSDFIEYSFPISCNKIPEITKSISKLYCGARCFADLSIVNTCSKNPDR